MKKLSDLSKEITFSLNRQDLLCHYVMTPQGPKRLKEPIMATHYACEYCNREEHFTPLNDPKVSPERVWLCANMLCDVYLKKKDIPIYKKQYWVK